jgi:hypothetical protein
LAKYEGKCGAKTSGALGESQFAIKS